MRDCANDLMRDLLPEYAVGALGEAESAQVAAHLDGCAACRAELELLGRVRHAVVNAAPAVNIAAIVAALPKAPASKPQLTLHRAAPHRARIWQYAAAATLVLAAGSSVIWRRASTDGVSRVADSSRVAGVETRASATSPASVREEEGITFGGGLSDLSVNDLQSLLGQMDSVRTLPSVDPESVTPVIAVNEGGKGL